MGKSNRTAVYAYKFAAVQASLRREAIWWPFNIDWSIDLARWRVQSRRFPRAADRSLAHSRPMHYLRFQHAEADEWFMVLRMLHLQGESVRIPPSRIIHPGTTTMSLALAHVWRAGWYPAFQRLASPWVISLSFRNVDPRGTSRLETAFSRF